MVALCVLLCRGGIPSPGSSVDTEAFFGEINKKLQLLLLSAAECRGRTAPSSSRCCFLGCLQSRLCLMWIAETFLGAGQKTGLPDFPSNRQLTESYSLLCTPTAWWCFKSSVQWSSFTKMLPVGHQANREGAFASPAAIYENENISGFLGFLEKKSLNLSGRVLDDATAHAALQVADLWWDDGEQQSVVTWFCQHFPQGSAAPCLAHRLAMVPREPPVHGNVQCPTLVGP